VADQKMIGPDIEVSGIGGRRFRDFPAKEAQRKDFRAAISNSTRHPGNSSGEAAAPR